MAKRKAGGDEGYTNPVAKPDGRFQPASDADNKAAHGADGGEPDDEPTELQENVARWLDEAIDFYEAELQPDQVKATEYFKGEPFGDEKEGRSKVVNPVVRDATIPQLASLMRIVYEAENVVEFKPREPEDEAGAKQATEYVRYVVTEDNPGFLIFWSWLMDALVRRLGVVKWWWDDTVLKTETEYTGLSEQEIGPLMGEPGVEVVSASRGEDGESYDITIRRVDGGGRIKLACLPNEEFVTTPNCRSLEDARLVAHVRLVPVDELRAMLVADGVDEDEADDLIEKHRGAERKESDELDAARQPNGLSRGDAEADSDEADDKCWYAEAYVRVAVDEYDEPGQMPELRLFKCLGAEWEIVNGEGEGECVDGLPFAVWTPIPEPHTIVGLSNYDLLKDVQRIISQIERGTLDSLAEAITPTTEVVYGMVNMQDFVNPEVAGLRRVKQIGMTREIVHHFVGGDTLPMLGYFNERVESSTGRSKGAMGLDADALQSTTKVAAAGVLSASQQMVELIARIFAETGLKPLFRGLLRTITKHQTPGRIVRLRNQYVPIDPRSWDATMDVAVNVALGAGPAADRIESLAGIASKQQELMQMGSPLATNVELRRTLARIVELSGEKHAELYVKPWGEAEEQALQQAKASQQPPPDPTMMLAQIEQTKVQLQAQLDQQKLELERWKAIREDDRKRDELSINSKLKEYEIELSHRAEIEDARLKAEVANRRAELDADVKAQQATQTPEAA